MISLLHNKKLITFIISFLIYATLCFQDIILPYNFLSIMIFILMFYGIYKTELDHPYKKEFSLISFFLSFLLILGRILYQFRYSKELNSLKELLCLKNIVYLFGISSLIYVLFSIVVIKLIQYKNSNNKKVNHLFKLSFILLITVYSVYYIIYYPGILTGDSINEMNMILKNVPLSDHHTIFHILFLWIPFKITSLFTNNINICIGMITLTQVITMCCILSYSIYYLNNRGTPKPILLGILFYYAFLPINGFYSITMWKDILFSLFVALLTIECHKLIEKKNHITIKNSYSFIIISILVVLSRNNAIYMYFILSLFILFIFRKKIMTLLMILIIVYSSYFMVKGPIYNSLHIKKSSSSEYIAIPLQQIGRMAYKNVKFTEYEKKAINKIIPISRLKKVYNPEIVDPIKFDREYHREVFENNKVKYLKIWVGLCIRNPQIAVESYLTSTLGYWYPGVEYWVISDKIDDNNLGIKNTSFVPESIKNHFSKITSSNIPLIGFTKCIGLCVWVIFILAYISIKRNNKKVLFSFIPVAGIWFTMLIATPVFAEFRYIYCAYLSLPILIGLIYSEKEERKQK